MHTSESGNAANQLWFSRTSYHRHPYLWQMKQATDNSLLQRAYDADAFRRDGHSLIEALAEYLGQSLSAGREQVLTPASPQAYWEQWQQMQHSSDPLSLLHTILEGTNHLHHPRYMGHQVVPPVPLAALADLVSDLLNNGMAVYEMGPSATMIERETIEWLAALCGFHDGGGVLTSGGTAGNLTALLAARQAMIPGDVWKKGLPVGMRPAVLVSSQAHYSISRATRIMGWGEDGCVLVPVKADYSIDLAQLEAKLQDARESGLTVIAIVGSAGTTSTGTYDDLKSLADFARQHNLWFHIDGAHGGAVVVSERYKHLAQGIAEADSVVIDFHKMLLTPALTTAVLFRKEEDSYKVFSQEADYLLDKGDRIWYDSAMRTLECTKKMMGLKVHFLRKVYGDALFAEYIDSRYDLARAFASHIGTRRHWELAVTPQSNIVCFRYVPKDLDEGTLNTLNASIRDAFRRDGRFYVVRTTLHNKVYLRITLMNPFTGMAELEEMLEMAEAFGKSSQG